MRKFVFQNIKDFTSVLKLENKTGGTLFLYKKTNATNVWL